MNVIKEIVAIAKSTIIFCSICQENVVRPILLRCGHTFCEKCFNSYQGKLNPAAKKQLCPNCKSIIPLGAARNSICWDLENDPFKDLILYLECETGVDCTDVKPQEANTQFEPERYKMQPQKIVPLSDDSYLYSTYPETNENKRPGSSKVELKPSLSKYNGVSSCEESLKATIGTSVGVLTNQSQIPLTVTPKLTNDTIETDSEIVFGTRRCVRRIQSDDEDSDRLKPVQNLYAAMNTPEKKLIEKYKAPVDDMDIENDVVDLVFPSQKSPKTYGSKRIVQKRNMSSDSSANDSIEKVTDWLFENSETSPSSSLSTLKHRQSSAEKWKTLKRNLPPIPHMKRLELTTTSVKKHSKKSKSNENSMERSGESLHGFDKEDIQKSLEQQHSFLNNIPIEKKVELSQEQLLLIDLITKCCLTNQNSTNLVKNCMKLRQELNLDVIERVEKSNKSTNTEIVSKIDTKTKATNTSSQEICSNCVPEESILPPTQTVPEKTQSKKTNKSQKPDDFVFTCSLDEELKNFDIESFSNAKRSRESSQIDLNPPKRPKLVIADLLEPSVVAEFLEPTVVSDSSSDDGIIRSTPPELNVSFVPETEFTQAKINPNEISIQEIEPFETPINILTLPERALTPPPNFGDSDITTIAPESMKFTNNSIIQSTPLPLKPKVATPQTEVRNSTRSEVIVLESERMETKLQESVKFTNNSTIESTPQLNPKINVATCFDEPIIESERVKLQESVRFTNNSTIESTPRLNPKIVASTSFDDPGIESVRVDLKTQESVRFSNNSTIQSTPLTVKQKSGKQKSNPLDIVKDPNPILIHDGSGSKQASMVSYLSRKTSQNTSRNRIDSHNQSQILSESRKSSLDSSFNKSNRTLPPLPIEFTQNTQNYSEVFTNKTLRQFPSTPSTNRLKAPMAHSTPISSKFPRNKTFKLMYTQLVPSQIELVIQFCKVFKMEYSATNCKSITHLIIQTDENNCVNDYTVKYVCAVSNGKWVVSFKWIQDSLDKRQIQPEDPYEVYDACGTYGPRNSRLQPKPSNLLKNFNVYVINVPQSFPRQLLEDCLVANGAKIYASVEELHRNTADDRVEKVAIAIADSPDTCAIDDTCQEIYEKYGILSVCSEWVFRTICQYEIASLGSCLLCSINENITGYPPELLIDTQAIETQI